MTFVFVVPGYGLVVRVAGVGAEIIGVVLAILGMLMMAFRVQLARFSREERERRGMRNAESQTPALVLLVGFLFFAVGAWVAIGTALGLLHGS